VYFITTPPVEVPTVEDQLQEQFNILQQDIETQEGVLFNYVMRNATSLEVGDHYPLNEISTLNFTGLTWTNVTGLTTINFQICVENETQTNLRWDIRFPAQRFEYEPSLFIYNFQNEEYLVIIPSFADALKMMKSDDWINDQLIQIQLLKDMRDDVWAKMNR